MVKWLPANNFQEEVILWAQRMSDMLGMSDILRAHKTTSSWKLFAGNHFTALCHDKGCTPCATYMLHLTRGANAGELGPQPEGLEHTLEEAWPEAIGCICQDASQDLEKANEPLIGWRMSSPP